MVAIKGKKGVVFTLIVFIYTIYILLLANSIFVERTTLEFAEQKRTAEMVAFDTYKNVLQNLTEIAEKCFNLEVDYGRNWVYAKQPIPYYSRAVNFGTVISKYDELLPTVHYFPVSIDGYFDRFLFYGTVDLNYRFLYGNYKGIVMDVNLSDVNKVVMHLIFDHDVNSIDKSCSSLGSGNLNIDFYFGDGNNWLRLDCANIDETTLHTINVYLTDDQNYAAKIVLDPTQLEIFSKNDFNVLVDLNIIINGQIDHKDIDVNFTYANEVMDVYLEK